MAGGSVGYPARRRARVAPVYSAPRLRNLNEVADAGPSRTGSPAGAPGPGATEECDRALVQRMAAGDPSALASLYDRWAECIHAQVFPMLRDADDAEDVVEAAFWQAWRTADRHETSRGSVRAWLAVIARSQALDRLRARRRWRDRTVGDLPDPVPADLPCGAESPLERAERAECRARIEEALGGLPHEQRQALELAFFGGFSQSEIARALGHPLGTVKTRIRLAMRKLRSSLSVLEEDGV